MVPAKVVIINVLTLPKEIGIMTGGASVNQNLNIFSA
jgi:hypothetical protein